MEDIKVGDMVKVIRRARDGEMINYYWDSCMDNMIGSIYKVDGIDLAIDAYSINGYFVPICCCEKQQEMECVREKFEINSKVKIIKRVPSKEIRKFIWNSNMGNMIGNIYNIEDVYYDQRSENLYYRLEGYYFSQFCCEKVNSNEIIMNKYSYKGVTDFDRIIEDNKDELAFIIKGKENFIMVIDKRIKSNFDCPGRDFFGIKEKDNKFWYTRGGDNTKFKFVLFNNEEFKDIKTKVFNLVKEFKSRTVKKVYTFK